MGLDIRRAAASLIWLTLGAGPTAFGSELYVAPGGNDGAQGTRRDPHGTIQKAADVARAGDVVHIAPGVYRETVAPKHSGARNRPITFRASRAGSVTITGTEPVTGWTKYAGHTYRAKQEWSLGKNNQVFVEGTPVQEARWPNDRDGDPMTPDGMKIGGGNVDHIRCPEFPAVWTSKDIEGAVVWALPQSQWSSWTATVAKYDPEEKRVFFPSFKGNWWVEARHNPNSQKGVFYLVGALDLLDAPGEWFYDEVTQMLYLWPPGNADPNQLQVEAKARQQGVDLSGRSWITIDGINLNGCTLDLDKASHCLVDNVKVRYISHTRGGRTMAGIKEKSGITINGHHNRVANSEIAYSAGNGVSLGGTDNAVVNCWIHHIDMIGAYCAPLKMNGLRHLVSHNTIERTGRDCIKLGGAEHLIQFNDISKPGQICHDLGAVYSGGMDGGNTRIRYNHVHDNTGGRNNVGIYLDNYMKNYIVDHNVVWNVGNGIRLNRPTGFCMVLNNTVLKDINNSWGPWRGQQVQWGCHVMNNLSSGTITMNPEVIVRGNLAKQDLTGVFDPKVRSHGQANPGRGRGVPIRRVTPGTNVDVGAYQRGRPAWRAGHDFQNPPDVSYVPADEPLRNHIRNAAFEYQRYDPDLDPLVHWTRIGAANVKVEFHKGFNSPPANARNSVHGNSVVFAGKEDCGIKQTVTTLLPNTTYVLSGYAKHADEVNVEFAVSPVAGKPLKKASSSDTALKQNQTWRFVCVPFKTGPRQTSASVTILKRDPGKAYVDDTGVVPRIYDELEK